MMIANTKKKGKSIIRIDNAIVKSKARFIKFLYIIIIYLAAEFVHTRKFNTSIFRYNLNNRYKRVFNLPSIVYIILKNIV